MKVSVVVTCYNEEEYIRESVQSVLDQTRYDLIDKVTVVNDGSEDGSGEIVRQIENENPKVEYVYQENQGLPGARNTGLERCTGDFVAFQDGDDIWLEHKIEHQAQVLEQYPSVGLVYSDFYLFGDGGRKRVSPNQYKHSDGNVLKPFFLNGGPVAPSTVVVNRECLDSVGMFDPELLRAQDTDLWLRIAKEYRFHHIREPLIKRRERPDSLGKSRHKKLRYLMRVTDKIASSTPRLQSIVKKRKSMIRTNIGRGLLEDGKRFRAIQILKKACKNNPLSLEAHVSLLFACLPLPLGVLEIILSTTRKIKKISTGRK